MRMGWMDNPKTIMPLATTCIWICIFGQNHLTLIFFFFFEKVTALWPVWSFRLEDFLIMKAPPHTHIHLHTNTFKLGCVGGLNKWLRSGGWACGRVCVYDPWWMFCALSGTLCVYMCVSISRKGKGSVSEGSGLTAGYNRDTLNSRLIRLTGGEQYTCIWERGRADDGGWQKEKKKIEIVRGSDKAMNVWNV